MFLIKPSNTKQYCSNLYANEALILCCVNSKKQFINMLVVPRIPHFRGCKPKVLKDLIFFHRCNFKCALFTNLIWNNKLNDVFSVDFISVLCILPMKAKHKRNNLKYIKTAFGLNQNTLETRYKTLLLIFQ